MRIYKMAVAVDQHNGFKPFCRTQRCRLQSYTHLDQTKFVSSLKQAFEVANSFHRSFSTPCISLTSSSAVNEEEEEEFEVNPKIEIVGGYKAPGVRALVVEVAIAIASGVDPMPVASGLGGAYFLRSINGDNIIAVAKPVDEEPLALNNPKGFGGRMLGQPGIKRSVRIGETGSRELAAYLLDHGGFAGVPPTALVKISNVGFHLNNNEASVSSSTTTHYPYKIASLQHFVDHDYDAGELGPSGFSVASVHRIGIFDVRLLNLDRHAGNMLVKKQQRDDDDHHHHDLNSNYTVGAAELVPIDHGLCLPEWLDDPYFEWLHWPQASVPFSESEVDYISNLDPFKDAELLRTELPSLREASIRMLVLCTIFLKQAAAAGLCLAEIGEMMSREFCGGEENLSALENVCAQAKASLPSNGNGNSISIFQEDNDGGCNDDGGNESKKSTEEQNEVFQFDSGSDQVACNEGLDLPQLLQSLPGMAKPPKTSRFACSAGAGSTRLLPDTQVRSPLCEENDQGDDESDKDCNKMDGGCGGGGAFTRSMSFQVQHNHSYEEEAGVITFADMSQGDWELFLKSFEKFLPEVFESIKCLSQKHRLGTSCKF
ncbi:hypothetical protein FEM48_Zijuj12G0010500 [Ziziphus jujuba var. spinosa]|uniref:1-phosphatidylinositol 4-kinase n=1 Tax=Ziziphus jujuba var. spinosa TaxID=714518 RepID=A0A978UAA7_ZIZJJ|nr:hypothetical protein FEM48_Zijuj12G0010500 [Ziziphus jujuba var. spinosa]